MASESPFRSVAIVAFGKLPILKPTSLLQDAQSNGFVAGLARFDNRNISGSLRPMVN